MTAGGCLSVARSGEEVVGVIVLLDPDGTAGPSDAVALEHATTVLTLELARRRAVAETELRLGRDLVEELLSGTESRSIEERARLLGYDLARPHRAVVVEDDTQRASSEDLLGAVRRAARDTGVGSLHTARGTSVVVLSHGDHDWERFRATVSDELGGKRQCRIGVGGRCPEPQDFPRSLPRSAEGGEAAAGNRQPRVGDEVRGPRRLQAPGRSRRRRLGGRLRAPLAGPPARL